ncbi:MAG: rhodanese-like domain-containing protein [Deltaproteobacteria bacterium]
MPADTDLMVGEVSPTQAQDLLRTDPNARLVDVRTQAEWEFVGVPDVSDLGQMLIGIEWAGYPGMIRNADFALQLEDALGGTATGPVLFICRSGARSLRAAEAFAAHMAAKGQSVVCLNVLEGFEGDRNVDRHRGQLSGWKARGLPWQQS